MYSEILKQSAPSPKPFPLKESNNFVKSGNYGNGVHVHRNTLLYIDHSNIFETAKKHSAKLKKYLPGLIDVACRIDVGKLVCKAVGNRKLLFGKLYGSEPPALDTVWDAIRKKDVEVKTFVRSKFTNREKEVDGGLIADAVEDIIQEKEEAGENRTVILFSGDRDLNQVVNKAIKHQYFVEIWAFKNSLNRAVINQQRENPNYIQINFIDDVFEQITYTNYTWSDPTIPPERSLVAFLSISECNASQKAAIFKEFVRKAGEIFRMPMNGKFINECEHLVLIPCLRELKHKSRFPSSTQPSAPVTQPNQQITVKNPSTSYSGIYATSSAASVTRQQQPRYPTTYTPQIPPRFLRNRIPQPGYYTENFRDSRGPDFPQPPHFSSQNTRSYSGQPVIPFQRGYPNYSVECFSGSQTRSYLDSGPNMGPHFNQNTAFFSGSSTRPFPNTNMGPFPSTNVGPFPSIDKRLFPGTYTGPYPGPNAGYYPGSSVGSYPGVNQGPYSGPHARTFPSANVGHVQGPFLGHTSGPYRGHSTRPMAMPGPSSTQYPGLNTGTRMNIPSPSDKSEVKPTSKSQNTPANPERNYDFYIHIQPNIQRLRESFKNICSLILPWNEFLAHDRPRIAGETILSPYRFEQLRIEDKEDDYDDEKQEVQQDLESMDRYSQISDSDFLDIHNENIRSNGDFTPNVRKSKPKRMLYSDYCIHKFWCKKGKLCAYKHSSEEREFFDLCRNPNQRVVYKTRPCFSKACKYIDKPYLCPWAHSLEESRCTCCGGKGNGQHWMDQCPENKLNRN